MLTLSKPALKEKEYKKRSFPLYAAALSQLWGENLNDFYAQLGMLGHNGIDVACPIGTPIYASHDGKVIQISLSETAGLGVKLVTNDTYQIEDTIGYYWTVYWHFSRVDVQVGQQVKRGEQIGLSGNTGMSTGPHLHFGLLPCYERNNYYYKLYPENGYAGYINPLPFIEKEENMKLIKKPGTNEVYAVVGNKRYWILDPKTLEEGSSMWGEWNTVVDDDPSKYVYGGAIFISNTDDPLK